MRKFGTHLIRRFTDKTNGNVAMTFALTLVPMTAVAGFAVDFQNTSLKKNRLQVILDSAVLAGAREKQSGATDDEITASVQNFIAQQSQTTITNLDCDPAVVTVSTTNEDIEADVTCRQDTSLMQVVGIEKVPFSVSSTSTYGIGMIDVAFMFDVSGSMEGDRIDALEEAAIAAVDILLPTDSSSSTSDVRIAMASYNAMVNAGDYFEDVTGVSPTRTYSHVIQGGGGSSSDETYVGDTTSRWFVGLYDADTDELISEIGDGAEIYVAEDQWDSLNIAVTFPQSSSYYGDVESMRLKMVGDKNHGWITENAEPYALFGDWNGDYYGESFEEGWYRIRFQGYENDNLGGSRIVRNYYDFNLYEGEGNEDITVTKTITSTCVWERDGNEKFTDAAPDDGAYLAHREAWFEEDDSQDDGGDWKLGHPERPGNSDFDGNECSSMEPVGLTNNTTTIKSYINSLSDNTGGRTAGHQGIAWSWYQVSEEWDGVFTGTEAPLAYNEPDSVKVVILMTDGAFNNELFEDQGDSDAQARALCDAMRNTNIKVYSIAFTAPSEGQEVLSYCATNSDYYFQPNTTDDLIDAYSDIATSIADLRIIR
ncbi:MAG: TadE/TadG family type IV pilus assembly protein [Pseudomonadota bacterium]